MKNDLLGDDALGGHVRAGSAPTMPVASHPERPLDCVLPVFRAVFTPESLTRLLSTATLIPLVRAGHSRSTARLFDCTADFVDTWQY
jgi:hypothetical protein